MFFLVHSVWHKSQKRVMSARKRHKTIAYERELRSEDLIQQLINNVEEEEESESDDEEEDMETLFGDDGSDDDPESEAQMTEPEEEEEPPLRQLLMQHSQDCVDEPADGVYYFRAGDIGLRRILHYRLRPPLQAQPSTTLDFLFQFRAIDYQRGWRTAIRIYGVTPTNYSVVVSVYGFEPYFFVKWPHEQEVRDGDEKRVHEVLQTLGEELQKRYRESNCVTRFTIQTGIDTGGYMEQDAMYLCIYLRCPSLVSKARRIIESPDWPYSSTIYSTYESDIDYVLRYMCDSDFSGECTLCIAAGKYRFRAARQSVCNVDWEIEVPDYRHLTLAQEQLATSHEITLTYDAEMRSMSGCFPVPNRDPIISVACYAILNDDESKACTVCFSLGSSNSIRARHPGADVLCYETEVDMMLGWRLFVLVTDPDIMTGYNIINFDLSYFLERVETLKHVDERATQIAYLGRITKRKSEVREDRKEDRAHGIRQNKKINVEGRIQMDMLPIMQKELKLFSYTLNNVSKMFLGQQKEDMSYSLIPEKHQSKEGRTELNSYCVKDALLPYRLLKHFNWKKKFGRKARVTGVPLDALLNRGLGFQGKSVVYRKFQRRHPRVFVYVRTELERQRDMLNPSYGGAHVEKPVKGYYTVPIATLDFSSLYPSIIIACNMCPTTRITTAYAKSRGWKRASVQGDGSDGDYFQIPDFKSDEKEALLNRLFHAGEGLDGLYSEGDTCFVTPKHREGVIPLILKEFLVERKAVKGQMAEHGEWKEKLREYAQDIVKTKEELFSVLQEYQEQAHTIQQWLQQDRPDKLKLQKDLKRLLWKLEELSTHVSDNIESRQQAAQECLSRAENEAFLEVLADLFQLEIKLCGNSMYGLFGAKTSFLYCMPLAAAVTSMGRLMILLSKLEVEKKFCKANGYPIDAKVVYGDSVASTTPLVIRCGGVISLCPVAELPTAPGGWIDWVEGKQVAQPAEGLEVWSDTGFTRVKSVMRHKTSKPVVQVCTPSGVVAVTEDHSLLRSSGEVVRPSELQEREELLTAALPLPHQDGPADPLLWLWGLYFVSGKMMGDELWHLPVRSQSTATRLAAQLRRAYPGVDFSVQCEEFVPCVQVWCCDAASTAFRTQWSALFHSSGGYRKIPDAVWSASYSSQQLFLQGCFASLEYKTMGRFVFPTELKAAGLYLLARHLGHAVHLRPLYTYRIWGHSEPLFSDRLIDIPNTVMIDMAYELALSRQPQRQPVCGVITRMQPFALFRSAEREQYVYDLETESHHFAAGMGQLVVHNTDSIMVKMEGISRDEARELALEMSKFASTLWSSPHKLEAEKIYQPSLFAMKKKYAAYVYMMDPETGGLKKPVIKSSGLETVRRDNCKFTTEVLDTALRKLMTDTENQGVQRSIRFIQEQAALLLQGMVSFYRLIISKQLRRDNYVNPTVHSVLAARLGKRAGERIAYVIKKVTEGAKLYLCGEDPDIAFRTGMPLDYDYYLKKQIMEPIIRLYAVVLAPHLDIQNKEEVLAIRRIVIRRIFSGAHMNTRLITVNREAIEKQGIFRIRPTCTSCKRSLKSHESQYCTACKTQRGARMASELRAQLGSLSQETACQWRQCQACMEVETATPIICDQNDCDNYWNRRKTNADLKRVSALLQSLEL